LKCSDRGAFPPAFEFLRDESRAKPGRAPFEGAAPRICVPPAPWRAGAHWGTTDTPSAGAVVEAGCPLDLVREFTSPSCLGGGASAALLPTVAAYGRSAAPPYLAGRAGAIMESRRSDQLQPSQHGTYSYSGASGHRTTLCTYYSSCPIISPSM